MIISFPRPCWLFEATTNIPRNRQTEPVYFDGIDLVITAPIDVEQGDMLTVDKRNGNLEVIECGGVAIWRVG